MPNQSATDPVVLNCELTGTTTSRDFIQPSIGQLPTETKAQRTFRITFAPLRFEEWSDEKNTFLPLCEKDGTCRASKSDAEYRLTTTSQLQDKKAGWQSDDQSEWTISRTSGAVTINRQFTHKSKFSYLVMTDNSSGTCKPADSPTPKF
jgi:hypothetical protein